MSSITKIVYYPATEKVYSPAELTEIFSAFSVHDPVIVALRQIFQTRFANAAIAAAETKLTEREAGHAGGRIQEITDFREELLGYLAQPETRAQAKAKGGTR